MATAHFADEEVACSCGCGMLPDPAFMDKIEELRVACDFPLPVSSGARCPTHNAAVSKTGLTGPHVSGRAVDIAVFGEKAHQLLLLAVKRGFTGIGIKQHGPQADRFIHLDTLPNMEGRPRPWIWSYP